MNPDIRLIAMDMDGTLLGDDQRISPANIEALHAAVSHGIAIAICSGRASGDAARYAIDAGLSQCYILSLNGAYCLESPTGKAFATHTIPQKPLDACLSLLLEEQLTFAAFQPNQIILLQGSASLSPKQWATHRKGQGAPTFLHGIEALQRAQHEGICKLVYADRESPARLAAIRQRLEAINGIDITSSWKDNLEVMPEGVGKGNAVRDLAHKLGITSANVMALGDYDNDLSMLRYAGYGVAMGNATQAVREAAPYRTGTNQENGVAQAIYRYAL